MLLPKPPAIPCLITATSYLYEANLIVEFESICDANLLALGTIEDSPMKKDLQITIMTHQAQAAETLGEVERAISINERAYKMREEEKPMKKLLLCYTANNLGYCYNTANDHNSSLRWYNESERWWLELLTDGEVSEARPARHLKNQAVCLLYLGDLKGAKELFDISLPRLEVEKPLNWAMLA